MPPEEDKTTALPESEPTPEPVVEAPQPESVEPVPEPVSVPADQVPTREIPLTENTSKQDPADKNTKADTQVDEPTETVEEKTTPIESSAPNPNSQPIQPQPTQNISRSSTPTINIRELAAKARALIQFRKRKKLDRILALFTTKSHITNDEVEKLLHVSDATATRYLTQLEKEGKIQQVGKTGRSVKYSKL